MGKDAGQRGAGGATEVIGQTVTGRDKLDDKLGHSILNLPIARYASGHHVVEDIRHPGIKGEVGYLFHVEKNSVFRHGYNSFFHYC